MVFRKIFINRREKRNMNKLFCQCLPVLDISKIPIYDFWYDYKKAEIWGEAKLCYMGTTDSFIVFIKTRYLHRYCKRY